MLKGIICEGSLIAEAGAYHIARIGVVTSIQGLSSGPFLLASYQLITSVMVSLFLLFFSSVLNVEKSGGVLL
ncbi:hypothetical protein KO02_00080 [Sphingobacterium sp. ML3W]|nr:hypothetical protein KO02_00080 [Sphingobacterium sp. ML3W]